MRTISARIAPEAISKVSRFFDAANGQIVEEMLQNARRAGAGSVAVEIDAERVTITDDGRGIADPQTLLAFGGSAWENGTARAEDPAGMGFFSLARRGATIESRTAAAPEEAWRIDLVPEHFIGERDAEVHPAPSAPRPHGTRVTFARQESDDDVKHTVRRAARYYPLGVTINRVQTKREMFLAEAIHVEEYKGVRIGVRTAASRDPRACRINFHGQQIECRGLPVVTPVSERRGGTPREWWTMVDIDHCPPLVLVLPRRDEVVATPFLDDLKAACLRAIFRAIAAHGNDTRLSRAMTLTARAEGIEITEPPAELHRWEPRSARGSWHDARYQGAPTRPIEGSGTGPGMPMETPPVAESCGTEPPLLMAAQAGAATQQVLARALDRAGLRDSVFQPVDQYAGYDWYNRIERITAVRVTTEKNGVAEQLRLEEEDENRLPTRKVDRIRVALQIENLAGEEGTLTLDTDVAFDADPSPVSPGEVGIVLADGGETDSHELTDVLMRSFFDVSDDCEGDSADTQEEWRRREYRHMATAATRSPAEARSEELKELTASYVGPVLHCGESVTAERGADGKLKVDVKTTGGRAAA